jgi:protein-histidine pros-kinase
MSPPAVRALIRRILLPIFIVSLLAGAGGLYLLLYSEAIRQAEQEARIMLSSARAVGEYTETHILPKLTAASPNTFEQEQVPFYASRTVFRSVTGKAALYTFRFPTYNPTNLDDRPTPFEIELITRFRDSPKLDELTGVHDVDQGKVFYLAHPIRIEDPQCLACHSTPERAPPAMLAKFGTVNGFGWKLHDTVGMEILTVPLTEQLRGTLQLVLFLAGGLLLIFVVAYATLSIVFDSALVRPLSALATAADAASQAGEPELHASRSAVREIRVLAEALERMRLSMTKAMAALVRAEARAPKSDE